MCIHRITHWQSCHHQRHDGIDVCKYAESHQLDPAKCPEGQDTFREGGAGDDCRICTDRERERRNDDHHREKREHSRDRHEHRHRDRRDHSLDSREESLDTVSSSVEREERGRERHREDRHDSREKDDRDGGDDRDGKAKKKGKDPSRWDGVFAAALEGVAYAGTKM
jgi:hypothetical protein